MSMNLFVPITKVDAVQRLVYGSLATEAPDRSKEIFDYETSKPFVEKWSGDIHKATDGKSQGNLRAMHTKICAGKFTEVTCNDKDKRVDVVAKVIDDAEWNKVAEGCYTGFSIGGAYVKKWKDGEHTRYTADPSEGSLADLPCNPETTFAMIKSDGATEMRKFHVAEPAADPPPAATTEAAVAPPAYAGPEQVWKAQDGQFFKTKAEAATHDETLAKAAADAKEPATQLAAALTAATAAMTKVEAQTGVAKKDFSDDERKKLADSGAAMPDGGYPIVTKADLENAIKAYGRGKGKAAIKAHIKTRAKALGTEPSLPDSWKDGADKATVVGALRKDLYSVSELANLIQQLEYFQRSQEYEAMSEGDNSPNPQKAKELVAAACALLRSVCEEETNEMLDDKEMLDFGEMLEMAAGVKGVNALAKMLADKPVGTKTGAVLQEVRKAANKAEAGHITAAHAGLAAAGAKCANPPGAGTEPADEETAKMAKSGARHGAADQAHLDSAHDHLDKMGACVKDGADASAEKFTKGMSGADKVHLNSAHDHISAMGIGKCAGMGGAEKMAKAGARHSKADAALLNDAHDHMAAAGAACPAGADEATEPKDGKAKDKADKSAPTGDLAKSLENSIAENAELKKTIAEAASTVTGLVASITKMGARIEHLEAQPVLHPRDRAPDKTLTVVSKKEDNASTQVETELGDATPETITKALINLARANGRKINP